MRLTRAPLVQQAFGRDGELPVQGLNHPYGQRAFAGQNLVDPVPASNRGDEVVDGEPLLLHRVASTSRRSPDSDSGSAVIRVSMSCSC